MYFYILFGPAAVVYFIYIQLQFSRVLITVERALLFQNIFAIINEKKCVNAMTGTSKFCPVYREEVPESRPDLEMGVPKYIMD